MKYKEARSESTLEIVRRTHGCSLWRSLKAWDIAMMDGWSDSQTFCIWKMLEMVKEWDFAMTDGMGIML